MKAAIFATLELRWLRQPHPEKSMQWFNNFILETPYLFLMKSPYLWLLAVVFYTWPPVVSAVITGIILVGLLAMNMQNSAWIEKVSRDFASDPRSIYIETLRPPAAYVVRNSLLLLALSAAIAWLLNGRLGLNMWQWGLFACGFTGLYRKGLFFGMRVTYIFTDQGLGIRYVPGQLDYRLFIRFNEIWSVRKIGPQEKIRISWTVVAPTRRKGPGLLLTAKNIKGFSTQMGHVVLTSDNLDNLIEKFPPALIRPEL